MDDTWARQYCRQIALPEVDLAGQERLGASRALVVGAGGLGSTAALLLAGAGFGVLELIDDDEVELSNLHRQLGHTRGAIGTSKVDSLADRISERYPNVNVIRRKQRFSAGEHEDADAVKSSSAFALVKDAHANDDGALSVVAADVVLDCTDNFQARYVLSAACWAAKKPLVSAAAIRLEGQLTTFDSRRPESPCYSCLYPPVSDRSAESCLSQGVLGPVPSVLASLQALEVCRLILGFGETLVGRLVLFDAHSFSFRTLGLPRDPSCLFCS